MSEQTTGVNWTNCPYWNRCEDKNKHIMTYCDIQCSNPLRRKPMNEQDEGKSRITSPEADLHKMILPAQNKQEVFLLTEIAKTVFESHYPDLEWGHSGTVDDDSWRRFERKCLSDAKVILAKVTQHQQNLRVCKLGKPPMGKPSGCVEFGFCENCEHQQKKLDRPELRKIENIITAPVLRKDCKCDVFSWGRNATCPTCTAKKLLALFPDKDTIIHEEQKREAGALRVMFEKGWTLADVIQAEDTMEEECTNIVEEAKKEEQKRILGLMEEAFKEDSDFTMLANLGALREHLRKSCYLVNSNKGKDRG